MEKQTVTMPGYMGKPWQVQGQVKAGLILHKMGGSWVISHIATGCHIGPGDRTRRDCKARMDRLLDVMPDWTAASLDGLAAAYGGDMRAFTDAVKAAAY